MFTKNKEKQQKNYKYKNFYTGPLHELVGINNFLLNMTIKQLGSNKHRYR